MEIHVHNMYLLTNIHMYICTHIYVYMQCVFNLLICNVQVCETEMDLQSTAKILQMEWSVLLHTYYTCE